MKKIILPIYILSLLIWSCTSFEKKGFGNDISNSQEQIEAGKSLFEQNCVACHNFSQTTIGPNLSGLTRIVESEWIRNFIQNPQGLIDQGDTRAKGLFDEFKAYMPSFSHLTKPEIESLLSYLHTFQSLPEANKRKGLEDPIPGKVSDSGIRMELEFFTQIPASDSVSPLAKITKLESEPISGRTFVQDQHGTLYELKNGTYQVYLPLKKIRPKLVSKPGLATGFGSYAFHPDFVNNGLLYTSHTEPAGTAEADFAYEDSIRVKMQWVLTEWKTNHPDAPEFSGKGRELIRINVVTQIHGVQELTFNPKSKLGDPDYGLLYIGVGDGGSAESGFPFISDHYGTKVWSSILRIDPSGSNSKNGSYGIPSSNPFANDPGKAGEVFAYGFRNPNRIFWDDKGKMFATEIGHKNIEELNAIDPEKFYGWPQREGTFVIDPYGDMDEVYELPKNDSELHSVYPVFQLDHDELSAIIGGYFVKKGPLKGKWLFGDVPSGRLFFADLTDRNAIKVETWGIRFEGKEMNLQELCGNPRVDLKFGQDISGQLYLMTKADGKIYKIKGT